MIKVENLYKEFDGKTILNDISIEYKPGQCSLIIGASGSGKTVLLKNLVGLHIPTSGKIWYGDNERQAEKIYQKRDGYAFPGKCTV